MTRRDLRLLPLLALAAGCGNSSGGDLALLGDAATADSSAVTDASLDLAGRDLGCSGARSCPCGTAACVDGAWVCPGTCPDMSQPGDGGIARGCRPACNPGSICVRDQINGGAVVLPMNGMCPAMRHLENNFCVRDPMYFCLPIPQGCANDFTCGCAGMICLIQQSCPYQCVAASASQIDCQCNVP